ncbi:MAG: bifunctional 2-polyprenyl-6-hydroxyphenol methylase/3-demethylubiquinol 3-O-methyltransferase UbiG [Pseudomonadota bacterium]|nr:bifunctional 2-polyprenyl-6-hydroxyphenol methylase/3-demethylubiquinol 3-O-methyltransferase UbiG [Pseudomonadota bacterium]
MNPEILKYGSQSTISEAEISHFDDLARQWWDDNGEFKALHRINPVRLQYITDQLGRHFGRRTDAAKPLSGLSVLDIGCGGGLITEPLARLGADVTGIDASAKAIGIAAAHAQISGLTIKYRSDQPEALAADGRQFDCVLSMEVIEHTDNAGLFVEAAAALTGSGGIFVGATLNRTLKSLVLGKIAAEYLLRWVPPGTHDWRKFVRPSEFTAWLHQAGLAVVNISGISYAPLDDDWILSRDPSVNSMLAAGKPGVE